MFWRIQTDLLHCTYFVEEFQAVANEEIAFVSLVCSPITVAVYKVNSVNL